eukprot:GFUD01000653.1.p1 GENE.GFUD01000653.1~~GFUD01000653.1.p1  ORF type:complete len:374 (+),score=90.43 GFUD01000653.1:158-1279(+)
MCAKYEDISPAASPLQKSFPLSSWEMMKVLAESQDDFINPQEEEEDQELSRVVLDIVDLEGECSNLSLGWDDIGEHNTKDCDDAATSKFKVETSENEMKESPKRDISCWSKVKIREKAVLESVPIQKGDLIEFLIDDDEWFLVEVIGKGKAVGKNRNYLNVRYTDGSEGGVFIDQHQWRKVKRNREEDVKADSIVSLNRVSTGESPVVQLQRMKVTEDEILVSENGLVGLVGPRSPLGNVHLRKKGRKKERSRNKSKNLPKHNNTVSTAAIENATNQPNNNNHTKTTNQTSKSIETLTKLNSHASFIRKGDTLEYLVKVKGEADIWFQVKILGRGRAGGKNRNYLNIRYRDGSEGGVFINKHLWRINNKHADS